MTQPDRKRPPKAFYILAPLLSVVVTLLLIELLLALFRPVPYSIERNMYYEPDPYTGYRLRPHSLGFFQNSIPAQVNSHGHRDDEVPLIKPEGVYRILLLGDSFTVGANVRQEEAYGQVLEELLNEMDIIDRPIEVVNAGVGGWEPFMYAQYYEHDGRAFAPDLVLIGFFVGNDAYNQLQRVEQLPTAVLGRRVSPGAAKQPLIRLQVFLHEHSHLMRLLSQQGPHTLQFTRRDCQDFSQEYLAIQTERMPTHLRRDAAREEAAANSLYQIGRIQGLAMAEGITLVVVLLPDENQLNPALETAILGDPPHPDYDWEMPQSMLREAFTQMGIATIDLLPAFASDPRCLYMNDTHWIPAGHRLAAEHIATELVALIEGSRE